MIEFKYNIRGKEEVLKCSHYYSCDKGWFNNAEKSTREYFLNTIKPDSIIIDAGAQIGMYSLLFGKLAENGKIYAFEPTDTINFLNENLKLNSINNVETIGIALSDKSGVYRDKIFKVWSQKTIEDKEFEFITIDDFVKSRNINVDIIKIDVDSYDYEVLLGAKETLINQNPIVVVELNYALAERGFTIKHAIDFMQSINYNVIHTLDTHNYIFQKQLS